MRAFFWNGGLHINPDTPEEARKLDAFAEVLCLTRLIEEPASGPPRIRKLGYQDPDTAVGTRAAEESIADHDG